MSNYTSPMLCSNVRQSGRIPIRHVVGPVVALLRLSVFGSGVAVQWCLGLGRYYGCRYRPGLLFASHIYFSHHIFTFRITGQSSRQYG